MTIKEYDWITAKGRDKQMEVLCVCDTYLYCCDSNGDGVVDTSDAINPQAVGLSAVLATSARAFDAVKWLGVAYLVWTGVRTLLTRPGSLVADDSHVPVAAAFRQGILVNALNPKTSLFFLSIFPQFVNANADNAKTQSLVLGLVFVVLATIFNGSYTLMASGLRDYLLRGRAVYVMRRYVSGFAFIGLALLAMTAGHPAKID